MKKIQPSFSLLFFVLTFICTMGCRQENKQSTSTQEEQGVHIEKKIVHDSLTNFGKRYAAAWSSKDPNDLAMFYTTDGILLDGDGASVTGRDSIPNISRIFHEEIPDMTVSLDSMVNTANGAEFHWTLEGTNTRGVTIKMTGLEVMEIENGLITKSRGSYTNAEYEQIVKASSENQNE